MVEDKENETTHKWYVLNTAIGREKKISKTLQEEVDKKNLRSFISEIVIPSEKVTEIKRGKKIDIDRKVCPGYLLLKMELTDKLLQVIRGIEGVAKFLGSEKKPSPIPEKQVRAMLEHLDEISAFNVARSAEYIYSPGDIIEIKDGAFEGFSACVEIVDNDRMKMTVLVSIFGRETPVELDFKQAKKMGE